MNVQHRRARKSKPLLFRWGIAAALLIAGVESYIHYTDPARLHDTLIQILSRTWKGDLSVGDVHYTPWGGLLVKDLAFSSKGQGRLDVPALRIRLSPLRALIGEAMLSDIEIQGALLALPEGAFDPEKGFPRLPMASAPDNAEERRGAVLITLSDARVTEGGHEAMALPTVALRCRYLSAAGTTDLTGEIAGPAWASGSFRASYGRGACRWDGALHGVELSARTRGMLWPEARKVWDLFSPAGTADLAGRGTLAPGSTPPAYSLELSSQDAEISFRHFPLPFRGVHGTVTFDESGRVDLREFWGYGVGALATCEGVVTWKGDHPYTDLDFTVQDLPVAPVVLDALPEGVRTALAAAGAAGSVSGRLRLFQREDLPEPACFSASLCTDNLLFQRLFLQPTVLEGRLTASGRLAGNRAAEVSGVIEIPRGELAGRAIGGLKGRLSWDGPRLQVDLDGAGYAGGTITGRLVRERKGTDDASTLVLDMADAQIQQMKQGTRLADQDIHGILSSHIEAQWKGLDASTLTGHGDAKLENGYLFTLPALSRALALLTLNTEREPVIRGGHMTFQLSPGKLTIVHLALPSDQVTVRASGTLTDSENLNLRIVASLGHSRTVGKIPVIKETVESLKRFVSWVQERGLYVYRVTGTLKEPKVESVKLFGLARSEVEGYHELMNGQSK